MGICPRRQARRGQGGGCLEQLPSPRQHGPQGRQYQPEGIDGPLVGVDPAGGGKHRPLRRKASLLERRHAHRLLQPQGRSLSEIGPQALGGAPEQGQIHIPVRAGVALVHQAGLGRQLHLIQQGRHRQLR